MRRLWQKGSDAIREARMDVTKQILDLEEQLDEHVLVYCGWPGLDLCSYDDSVIYSIIFDFLIFLIY